MFLFDAADVARRRGTALLWVDEARLCYGYCDTSPRHGSLDWVEGADVERRRDTLQHTATHCNTLQHTATHCNTL